MYCVLFMHALFFIAKLLHCVVSNGKINTLTHKAGDFSFEAQVIQCTFHLDPRNHPSDLHVSVRYNQDQTR